MSNITVKTVAGPKIIWANFLHLYQPPNQNPALLKIIAKESYQLIIELLEKHPQVKITLNIAGGLTELLLKHKREEIIRRLKALALKGQIELTGSAKYHPILPLIPVQEIKRLIELNDKINKSCFGQAYQPRGFFCPEMAYNHKVGEVLKKMGYQWLILDEIAYQGKIGLVDYNKKYQIGDLGLFVIFRNRAISQNFAPSIIEKKLKSDLKKEIIITANDGELYGHHHKNCKKTFSWVVTDKNLETTTISSLLKRLRETEICTPLESSWETTEEDLKNHKPFTLWHDPANEIHRRLWQLANTAINIAKKYNPGNKQVWGRKHLDQGLASCSWWWAAGKKIGPFGLVTWNPDEIEKGARELIKSIRTIENLPSDMKKEAENMYSSLIKTIWRKHWDRTRKSALRE